MIRYLKQKLVPIFVFPLRKSFLAHLKPKVGPGFLELKDKIDSSDITGFYFK